MSNGNVMIPTLKEQSVETRLDMEQIQDEVEVRIVALGEEASIVRYMAINVQKITWRVPAVIDEQSMNAVHHG